MQTLIDCHLANIAKPFAEQDLSIYAESLRVEFPFAPQGHTTLLEGPEALGRFLAAIGEFTQGHTITQVESGHFDSGFVLEYEESSVFRSTGRAYSSRIVWTARVENGKIVRLREHYNPLRVLDALIC